MKNAMKFPKRFELENVNPMECPVKVVAGMNEILIFQNMNLAAEALDLSRMAGPMADKHEGQRCVRFESKEVYENLSK